MEQLLTLGLAHWQRAHPVPAWIAALEAGSVLYFPGLAFAMLPAEQALLDPQLLAPGARNISLDAAGRLKGAASDHDVQRAIAALVLRFRSQAQQLIEQLLPQYRPALRLGLTSLRPMQVETRMQSWRADDRRLHIDAFPSRPNRGERLLRVFANVNPHGEPRVWRIGEPFEVVARRFLPRTRRYSRWQAQLLRSARITKTLRTEYDHLMVQLHDAMKFDLDYQRSATQQTVEFASGSIWVCFSDQTSHAVMAGQFLLEQTLLLPPDCQYDIAASPLAVLQRLTARTLT